MSEQKPYRGKPVIGGPVVHGWYWYNDATGKHYIRQTNFQPAEFDYTDFEVIPSSVGQSTGWKDVRGTESYHHDIVKSKHYGRGEIVWAGQGWGVADEAGTHHSLSYEFTIIGNATDNPELLEANK